MKKLREILAAGVLGAGLAGVVGLGAGGCMVTPTDVENFLGTGSFKGQSERQWTQINGQMGFINKQGFGLVPLGEIEGKERYDIYQMKDGKWYSVNNRLKGFYQSGEEFTIVLKD